MALTVLDSSVSSPAKAGFVPPRLLPANQASTAGQDWLPRPFLSMAVLIPAYNEENTIGSTVLLAHRYVETVVVVDDGSADATATAAMLAGARVLSHPQNRGKGAALATAFSEARKLGCETIVVMDADAQHRTEEIPSLAAPILQNQADMVIGSRYLDRGCRVPLLRRLGHCFFNILIQMTTGITLSDSQSGFRAFSRRALAELEIQATGFTVEVEMVFLCARHGWRYLEVPIQARYLGRSKRSLLKQGWDVLVGLVHLSCQGYATKSLPCTKGKLPFLLTGLFLRTADAALQRMDQLMRKLQIIISS